jgi:archaellum component FlaG (FlaF/FlaG flagellin family)
MSKSLLAIAAASMMFAGAGIASAAETSTTTTSEWTNAQGTTFTEYSKTKNYSSVNDPSMKPTVGMELPGTITLYPLPDTMKVQSSDKYRYSIINDHPVVVESTTRKVVHSWE